MHETVITVRGEFSSRHVAERAIVQMDAAFDGADRQEVFARASAAAEAVRHSVAPLYDSNAGPITEWSSDTISVWSERPWNNEGLQLPLVYHAKIGLSVKFRDFEKMSGWIEDVVALDGLTLGSVQWELTEGRKTTVTAEVRSRAVKDAVAKATVYAQSIGLGSVRAIAIADPGMLGDQGGSAPEPVYRANAAMMKSGSGGGGPELVLKPQEIDVSATVDARFVAS